MRAVQYDAYGGGAAALKHVEIPIPSPKQDELLLKLEAASLNPVDWKIQSGFLKPFQPRKFPFIPATNVAGEVVEVGPGVNSFKQGDKVVTILEFGSGGGLAEYAVARANITVKLPPEVSTTVAAGLPVAGLIALQALTHAAAIKFDGTGSPANILITAASGGAGHHAVQLAKLAGNLHVTATCGSRNIDFVRSLGADEVLDYKTPEGAALKSPSGRKYDAVVHCATGIAWSVFEPNLSENGVVVNITPSPGTMVSSLLKRLSFSKKRLVPLMLAEKREELEFLIGLVRDGKLKTAMDSTFLLSEAEKAWERMMEGHATGKIMIDILG
ncbi:hypothetical protein QJS10_CPB04g01283 [Acorus calamus]|uniref:Enoyl reductase (ER) domain-containing protein n=1 Tax=Acorus calamus TaxID=4465 RepID=A0AAV9EXE5_ACOCL|nr:hypothetical protein QJS10_CPB04g01283 [Acorus calamus]